MAEPRSLRRRCGRGRAVAPALLVLGVAGPAAAAPPAHTVTIENMLFTPQTLTVKRGERVVWVNKDLFPHTATAPGVFDSKSIAPNTSWTHVAERAGRHGYLCTLHPTMKATLVVER